MVDLMHRHSEAVGIPLKRETNLRILLEFFLLLFLNAYTLGPSCADTVVRIAVTSFASNIYSQDLKSCRTDRMLLMGTIVYIS